MQPTRSILRLFDWREKACIAALEFALLAPTFVLTFAAVVDLGSALYTWSRIEGALAAGSNYAVVKYGVITDASLASSAATFVAQSTFVNPTTNTGTAANVTVVVNNGITYTLTAGVGASSGAASASCYCPTGSPTSWTWGSAVVCGSACAGGGTAGKFVAITASESFTPFFAGYNFVHSGSMTDGVMVQTQ
jgi:Flp pilus assembly protein TadG